MQRNIAQTAGKNDRKLIEALRKSKVYRQYETVFTQATGLPLALRPIESFELPFHGRRNENAFCAFLADQKGACTFCLQTQQSLDRNKGRQPVTAHCPFGLTETRVPVHLGERLIGFLQIGQVFTEASQVTTFKNAFRKLFPNGSAPEKKVFELWRKTPRIPVERYKATVALLNFFAKQLSALSNQIMIETTNTEPPVVQKAREYIDNHKTEVLSLSAVARAAGASVFHFCKLFHKSTGTNFTDYVSRARIQDAKARLLNPNLRISEVAYDVGFQSLTQFNRTFRRIFGQSPTEYRANVSKHSALAA
jgi:AraC-like DNA-binding protein